MKRIYIAGPISGGTLETLANIRAGLKAAAKAIKQGFAPFIPHLDFQLNLVADEADVLTKEEFQANSMAFVDVCEEMWILPGWENSGGTKREMERAKDLGIPIKFI
jgi:hypothetical protein